MVLSALTLVLAAGCSPDTRIDNVRIHTVDPHQPVASALVLNDCGRFEAVGDSAALSRRYPDLRQIDGAGGIVVPGLIDAHGHIEGLGMLQMRADLVGAASKAETLERLQEFARNLPPDAWLLGRGWDQNDWSDGREFPHRSDLDALFPDRPVWLTRVDGHASWANSAALAHADRDFAGNWQVEGGEILRDADGHPTGIFIDRARDLVDRHVPRPDASDRDRALTLALRKAAAVGLTGIHEAGTSAERLAAYLRRQDAGTLGMRIYAMADGEQALFEQLCKARVETDRVVARAVKIYADGALGSRGAAMLDDYADRPGTRGLLLQSPEALGRQIDRALGCGLQVAVHAIGDRANRVALDLIAAGMRRHPANPGRHRIEHAQVIHADDQPRFARLGVIASVQPTHATSDMYWAHERLGPARVKTGYLWRSLLESGARLALGSDFPVESPSPVVGLHAAVSRTDAEGWPEGGWFPGEALTPAQALRGFTLDAAWAAFMEEAVGSIQAGKQADFVVLTDDPLQLPAHRLLEIQVLVTVLGGQVTHLHESAAAAWRTLPRLPGLE